jgi:hypothetical protein
VLASSSASSNLNEFGVLPYPLPDGFRRFYEGKIMLKKIGGVLLAVAPMSAFALPPDFTSLTTAIDLSTVQTAALVALAALMGLYLIISGGKTIVGFFKGR